jgi:hypothetical protein
VKATVSPTPVTSPLSGRQRAISKLSTTALGHYKLGVPLALLGCHEANAPARASDHPPEPLNFSFSPNSVLRAVVSELAVARRLLVRSYPPRPRFNILVCYECLSV